MFLPILLAYTLAGIIAYLAHRAGALTASGAFMACAVGGTIFGFGGLAWAVLLALFFVSSSALSFFRATDARKRAAAEAFEKGGRRDAAQVFANGGVGAMLALLSPFAPPSVLPTLFAAYAGAIAAATADTWATEVGTFSNRPPRLITTGESVAPGTSGGVTWLGNLASLAGALLIGVAAASLSTPAQSLTILFAALVGGIVGALGDSLLGATFQAVYWCPHCERPTESRRHRCGNETQLVRGLPQINNDLVNLLATLVGALAGGAISWVMYNWII